MRRSDSTLYMLPCTIRWLEAGGGGGSSTWRLHTAPHRASGIHDKAAAPAGLAGGSMQRRQIAEAAVAGAAPLQHGPHRCFTWRRPQPQHVWHQQRRDSQQLDAIQISVLGIDHKRGPFRLHSMMRLYRMLKWRIWQALMALDCADASTPT